MANSIFAVTALGGGALALAVTGQLIQGMVTMASAAAAPPFVGWLPDRLQHLPNGLIVAIVSVAVPSLLLSATLPAWCERRVFETTVADAARLDDIRDP